MNREDRIKKVIDGLSKDFLTEERETSILYDHSRDIVLLETSHTFTARRWWDMFKDDDGVIFDMRSDTLKMEVPASYCRKSEMVIKHTHR